MASLGMFLGSLFLMVAGGVLMEAYNTPGAFAFVIGLFTLMGGIFLFAISLNFGPPPATHPLPPVEADHGPAGRPGSSGH